MKTPMQEMLERVKWYRDSETSPLVVSRLNSIYVDILGMFEKEKEVIVNAYIDGYNSDCLSEQDSSDFAEQYYNNNFNTNEK
jgi:hypothetical protein